MDRLRAGLQNDQITGDTVLGPLDVHGLRMARQRGIMVFNQAGPSGQGQYIIIGQTESPAFLGWRRLAPRPFAATRVDEPDFLRAESPADDGAVPRCERRFEDRPLIWRDHALDHELAEP